jgi:tetratricopeptide (TPR) repeat protein
MQKKLLLSVLTILMLCGVSFAGSGDVKKAIDFRKAGMYKQATAILTKEINGDPTNAEAHFQLGLVYAAQGNMNAADERFSSAIGLNSNKYALLIGNELKQAGSESLKTGRIDQARAFLDLAVQYQPNLREKICIENYQLGNQAHDAICVNYYLLAGRYCTDYNQEIGQRLVKIANNQTTIQARETYLNHAKKFISLERLEKVPEASFGWKVSGINLVADLEPGQEAIRVFNLKEGESTPLLIMPYVQEGYKLRMDTPQAIIWEENGKKIYLGPTDHYSGGDTFGVRAIRFTAVKGGAGLTIKINRIQKKKK